MTSLSLLYCVMLCMPLYCFIMIPYVLDMTVMVKLFPSQVWTSLFQPHPLAINVTLPIFAADCRVAALLVQSANTDTGSSWLILLPTQHSASNSAAVDRWDRQADEQTLNCFIDSAPNTLWAVLFSTVKLCNDSFGTHCCRTLCGLIIV